MTTNNPYSETDQAMAHSVWEDGWTAGYDKLEEDWCRRMLPIVGELEEHIRYDWEGNDCLQVGKIKLIFDVFYQYAPEHDWLKPLIQDAVEVYKSKGLELNAREESDLRGMANSFGIPMKTTYKVTATWTEEFKVEADDWQEAEALAEQKVRDDRNLYDMVADMEFEAEEV